MLCLLFTFGAWARPDLDLSKKHLDFYAHHLSNARSEILGAEDCRIKASSSLSNVELKIDAGNKIFHSADFDLGLECLIKEKRVRLKGHLMLEESTENTVVKSMTFDSNERKFNYHFLLAELGYFSLEDISGFKQD